MGLLWVIRTQCNHESPYGENGRPGKGERDAWTEARSQRKREVEDADFEDGGRRHQPRRPAAARSWKRQGNRLSHGLLKETQPC